MGSTRLPGKVLQPILHRPMLWWVVNRLQRCRLIDGIVVATTSAAEDNAIVDICTSEGWLYFRGSDADVLDRYYQAAQQFHADHVVRITSDCPLIDPSVTDNVIATYQSVMPHPDYAANVLVRTYPRGLDTEIFSFTALCRAWSEDHSVRWREHVTPYIHQQPHKFRLVNVANHTDFSQHRWTVDTAKDMDLVRRIYDHFGHGDFGWRDTLSVLEKYPNWSKINWDVEQKAL